MHNVARFTLRSRFFSRLALLPVCVTSAACTAYVRDDRAAGDRPSGSGASAMTGSVAAGAATMGGGSNAGAAALPDVPFEPTAPAAYVAKVKNLLTGLPPTDADLSAVIADPAALAPLIDQWMTTEQFRSKQIAFFRVAFQQGNLTETSWDLMAHDGYGMSARLPAYDNAMDSFPRTAWDIVERGAPFTDVITTDTWMLTPALASVLTWFDSRKINDKNETGSVDGDEGQRYDIVHDGYPNGIDVLDSFKMSPVMHFYSPCAIKTQDTGDKGFLDLNRFFWGQILGSPMGCDEGLQQPAFTDADFTTWRPVRLRQANPGELHSRFYDLDTMRNGSELTLTTPHVGFFTTPAFFGNWPTNSSNQGRVTTNQTLIVALGGAFNPADVTIPLTTTTLSPDHAAPNTICYACHRALDPMRVFFRRSFSIYYGQQDDPAWTNLDAGFSWGGVSATGKTIEDFAKILATHPAFAGAWTQKLCFYANSEGCDATDPEFVRVSQAFAASNFNYKTLVRELFSSPLVTGAAKTQTFAHAPMITSITRRTHFCALLEGRLGVTDPCGLRLSIRGQQNDFSYQIASNIPDDAYSRGSVNAQPPSTPSLFTRATVEALCSNVAQKIIDPAPAKNPTDPAAQNHYPSTNPDAAMVDMVRSVMALPDTDPRSVAALSMLRNHFKEASAIAGIKPADALRSAFTLACTSPTAAAIGL